MGTTERQGETDPSRATGLPGSVLQRPRRRLWDWLQSVVAVTVIGTLLTAYFQARMANNDKAVTKRQADSGKAFDVEQQLSRFIDQRWAAADEVARSVDASDDKWKHAIENYQGNFEQWQSQLARWAGQVAFYVDLPFDQRTDDQRKEIQEKITCLSYTLNKSMQLDHNSASHILQIIDHCHDLSKKDL